MSFTQRADKIAEDLQDLAADAIEEGFDDEATCIEDVLETLQTLKFAEPEPEQEEDLNAA